MNPSPRGDEVALALRGTAPRRSPTVRVLAAYSGHTDCNVAALAFAASVDMDKLLVGTPFQAQFGQSPFALARGNQFERSIRQDGYARALELLRTKMGFDVTDARIINLRDSFPRNRQGMVLRASETRSLIGQILRGDRHAPNLIDGAVLKAQVGGETAFFEADALAARFAGPIHGGEVKSFPVVDGRAEPDKLGAALDQISIYILLTQQLVAELGGDPDLAVSMTAMLIAPRNVGLTPSLEIQNVASRVRRVASLLDRTIPVGELAAGLPGGIFGQIADRAVAPSRRLDVLDSVVERVGTKLTSGCLSSCGAARYCRARAVAAGSPAIGGEQVVRLLPGITSLPRAAELAAGAPAGATEVAAAAQLARAGRLYRQKAADTPSLARTNR
jgi:hypothetical protein